MKKVSVKKSPFDSLSDETKASLLYGHGGWHTAGIAKKGLDPLEMHDGPLGIRYLKEEAGMTLDKTSPSTCFPAPCLLACSFNPSLEEKIGGMMALECRAQKTGMLLAPGVNIKRNPLCGRNFEYLSEDPLLAGEMAAGFIKGLQNNGVGACLKHYAANSQETQRMISDSIVDERALQEIYLKGFGIAIKKAQPWTVMSAYNLVNGTYCSDSDYLLRDVLRKQFGFTGAVVSDWGGTNDPILSHNHGLDVEMPCYVDHQQALLDALKSGKLTRENFDESAQHVYELLEKANAPKKAKGFTYGQSHALCRQAITESAVLLKNDNHILPLQNYRETCVIGAYAKTPRIQGSGSSRVQALQVTDFIDYIDARRKPGDEVPYAPGYSLDGSANDDLAFAALDLASRTKNVLYFMALPASYESEGFDREDMELPANQLDLLKRLYAVNQNIVVILSCGSPVELPFLNEIKGLLLVYLTGEAFGEGVDELLLGKVSPSGKLAETWPLHYYDVPTRDFYPGRDRRSLYKDSIFVGYRFYATAAKPVAFPFGYGLSYADFSYSKLVLSRPQVKDAKFTATLNVENLSSFSASTVLELYVHPIRSKTVKPMHELKAFQKIALKAHGKAKAVFELDPSIFAHYDVLSHSFVVEGGQYKLEIANGPLEVLSSASIRVSSDWKAVDQRKDFPDYFFVDGKGLDVPVAEFEKLLGHPLPPQKDWSKRPYTFNSTLNDMQGTWIGRKAKAKVIENLEKNASNPQEKKMFLDGAMTSPLRAGQMGNVPHNVIESLLLAANGHPIKGLNHYLFGKKK